MEGERLAKVETRAETLIRNLTEARAEMRELRADIRDLRSIVDRNFLWLLGIILAMWVTLIVATLLSS